jgi:pimeloyl-ACP methyl ester carboxylesterase
LKLLRWLPLPAGKGDFTRTLRRETVALLASADSTGIAAALRGAALSDLPDLERLRQLKMPTLILAWGDDPVHPLSTARLLAATLPHAELMIAKTGNDPWQWGEQLQRFIQAQASSLVST